MSYFVGPAKEIIAGYALGLAIGLAGYIMDFYKELELQAKADTAQLKNLERDMFSM